MNEQAFIERSKRIETGQGLVEYALVLIIVVLVVIAVLTLLSKGLTKVYDNIRCNLPNVECSQEDNHPSVSPNYSIPSSTLEPEPSIIRRVSAKRKENDLQITVQVSKAALLTIEVSIGISYRDSCFNKCTIQIKDVGDAAGTVTVSASNGERVQVKYPSKDGANTPIILGGLLASLVALIIAIKQGLIKYIFAPFIITIKSISFIVSILWQTLLLPLSVSLMVGRWKLASFLVLKLVEIKQFDAAILVFKLSGLGSSIFVKASSLIKSVEVIKVYNLVGFAFLSARAGSETKKLRQATKKFQTSRDIAEQQNIVKEALPSPGYTEGFQLAHEMLGSLRRNKSAWAHAKIKDSNQALYVNRPSSLEIKMGWEEALIEGKIQLIFLPHTLSLEPIEFVIFVSAPDTQGIQIEGAKNGLPQRSIYRLEQNPSFNKTLEITITPKTPGLKRIAIDFYYELHFLERIEVDFVAKLPTKLSKLIDTVLSRRKNLVRLFQWFNLKVVQLPPTGSLNYCVASCISVYFLPNEDEGRGRYVADIDLLGERPLSGMHTAINKDELKSINDSLRHKIQTIARHLSRVNSSPDVSRDMKDLAGFGNYVFTKIFPDKTIQSVIKEKLLHERTYIHIDSESFFLPWELLYIGDLEEPYSLEHFLGAKHIISRNIRDARQNQAVSFLNYLLRHRFKGSPFVSADIHSPIPRLALLTNERLPYVKKVEKPYFDRLNLQGVLELVLLPPLPNNEDMLKSFRKFCSNEFDLVHFACHIMYDEHNHFDSFIELGKSSRITFWQLESMPEVFTKGNPLVVINACDSGNLDPRYTSDLVRVFTQKGVRGVIATECQVPDRFAAEFAERFYIQFLEKGMTLGDSLFETRRYFITEHNNPTGLLYSMYASPLIKSTRQGV